MRSQPVHEPAGMTPVASASHRPMSPLAPLLHPSSASRPVVRARLQQMATALRAVGDKIDLSPDFGKLHQAWLELLATSSGAALLPAGWGTRHAAQLPPPPQLAPDQTTPLLQSYGRHLGDAEFVTASEFFATLHRGKRAHLAASAALPRVTQLAREISLPASDVFGGTLHAPDFAALEKDLAGWLELWLQTALVDGPERAVLVALAEFAPRLAGRHAASDRCWRFLLQRLAATPAIEALGAPALAGTLQAARTRFPLLARLGRVWTSHAELQSPTAAALRTLLDLHLQLACLPNGELAREAIRHLQSDAIAHAWQSAAGTYAALRTELLRAAHDESCPDAESFLADAVSWLNRIAQFTNSATLLRREVEANTPTEAMRRQAALLAAELVFTAQEFAALALDPALAESLLREFIVTDLGADSSRAEWISREGVAWHAAQAMLSPHFAAAAPFVAPVIAELPALLERLAPWSIASNRQLLRANFMPAANLFATAAARTAARHLTETVVIRLCVAGRLGRDATAEIQAELPPENWREAARALAPRQSSPIGECLERLALDQPERLLLARLERAIEPAAADSARHLETVFSASRPGASAGNRLRHAQDNLLLIRALVASLRHGAAADAFAVWWRAELQPFASSLPADFAPANCSALRHALASQIDPGALERVMALLEGTLASAFESAPQTVATFDEATPALLAASLQRRVARVEPSSADLRLSVLGRIALLGGDHARLSEQFDIWLGEATRELARATHPAAALAATRFALARFAAAVGTDRAVQLLALLAAQTSRHVPGARLDTPWPAWTALAVLSLQALEQDLLASSLQSSWLERAELPAPPGVAEPVLAALHPFLLRQLRSQTAELAGVNLARFAVEQLAPALAFSADAWRDTFAAWHRVQVEHCPEAALPLLAEIAALFERLSPLLAYGHVAARRSFAPEARFLGPDLETDRTLRGAFALVLVAGSAGENDRFADDALLRAGWQHLPQLRASLAADLIAHTDRLFDHLDPEDYFHLLAQIDALQAASPTWLTPSQAVRPDLIELARALADVAQPRPSRGMLGRLRGAAPSDLAAEFARAEAAATLAALRGDVPAATARAVAEFTLAHLPRELAEALPAARQELRSQIGPRAPSDLATSSRPPMPVAARP